MVAPKQSWQFTHPYRISRIELHLFRSLQIHSHIYAKTASSNTSYHMGLRNTEFSDDETMISSSPFSDALIFATICIIGLPVDVHIKDGSVFSGIFHTACLDDDYGIVLKRAIITKKGKQHANVRNGDIIETLVILSKDLVQVVAKGVLPPPASVMDNIVGDEVQDVRGTVPSFEYLESEAKTTKHSRSSSQNENGFSHGLRLSTHENDLQTVAGKELKGKFFAENCLGDSLEVANEISDATHLAKAGEDKSLGKQDDIEQKSEKILSRSTSDSPAPKVSQPESHFVERVSSGDIKSSDAISSGVSTSSTSVRDVLLESRFSSTMTTTTEMVPPQSSDLNRNAKEFKLNPGAKTFSPSFANSRAATPAVPAVASMGYIPNNSHMEIGSSPLVPRSSLPVKFVPYNIAGNGTTVPQYSQQIAGHVGSRVQSVRYGAQYHPVQGGSGYMHHPNTQNIMVGRVGQVFYVHPFSHDVVHGAAALSQVSARPLLPPHQSHFPKHQGAAGAQAMQLCVTPTYIANPQQPLGVPTHAQLTPPPFPGIHPIQIPGSTGLFSTKFP